jgi:hypothetical protein
VGWTVSSPCRLGLGGDRTVSAQGMDSNGRGYAVRTQFQSILAHDCHDYTCRSVVLGFPDQVTFIARFPLAMPNF